VPSHCYRMRGFDRDLIRGGHYGQRSCEPHLKAEHMAAPTHVTQSFNTTTSMGRLTLNILLSFAQFEREVIGERIRDKFAASRKKGIWMGGWAPLGYDIKDRKLIVNMAEAASVRRYSSNSPVSAR
jgi:DNA invertase Pin-like site-specific DNA recombinase